MRRTVRGIPVDTTSAAASPSRFFGTRAESRDFLPLLRWLILMCLTVFAVAVLWELGLIRLMFDTDRTRISSLILALFSFTTLHCMTQQQPA